VAGRLVDIGDGQYTIDTGSIRYVLPGLSDPALSSACPALGDPEFFSVPALFHSAVIDSATGSVVGIDCEFQYSD